MLGLCCCFYIVNVVFVTYGMDIVEANSDTSIGLGVSVSI